MATQAQLAAVQQLYVGYLGRAADSAGQQFWANAIANGTATIASVATGFTLSAEYKAAYGGLTTDALVEKVYNNVLGRTPDAEGKAFWVAALANGKVTADTLVATIVTNLGALDQQTINNKVFVAQTYTDTAGASYNPTAGAQSIVGVDSTAASVSTAVTAIANGTLAGQVPGLTQVNALAATQTTVANFEAANKTTIDALVAKLAAATPGTTATDNINATTSDYQSKVDAVVLDATAVRTAKVGAATTTAVLTADAADKATATTAAYNALNATEKAQADKYVAAIAAEATAKAAAASDTDYAAVLAGLTADTTAATALGGTTAKDVYSNYVNGDATARAAIDTAFKDSAYYNSTFKATATKDAAYADALKATAAAKDVLDAQVDAGAPAVPATATLHAGANAVTVTFAVDAKVGSANADAYVNALASKTLADSTLAAAKVADVDVAAAAALQASYKTQTDALAAAQKAINDFNNLPANSGVIAVKDIGATTATTDTVKDVFYFAAKPTGIAADDVTINKFGAGDSIVLGSSVAYNAAGMGAANNNAAEFFLVKTDTGMQVVIENTVYGSAGVTPSATTGVGAPAADNLTVITLTGVTAEHLSVANGVISYV